MEGSGDVRRGPVGRSVGRSRAACRQRSVRRLLGVTATAAASLAASAAVAVPAASALPLGCSQVKKKVACPKVSYKFQTLNDAADRTFNQLLGINQSGVIAGYFGSGAAGHPNQGYLLFPNYTQNYYASNNFPGSVQTQATGINDLGVLVGFYSSMNNANMVNDNHGWYKLNGQFFNADFPNPSPASPVVDQLLGVNDKDVAVGFFTDAAGVNHGYSFNIATHQFSEISVPGITSPTAAAINNNGDIAGFGTAGGATVAFLLTHAGKVDVIKYPNASSTQALGVNNNDEVVGVATIGSGSTAKMNGFTYYPGYGFKTINAPAGVGTTTINGVNSCGDLVGFYVDGAGNTDGLLANAQFSSTATTSSAVTAEAGKKKKTKPKKKTIKTVLPKGC